MAANLWNGQPRVNREQDLGCFCFADGGVPPVDQNERKAHDVLMPPTPPIGTSARTHILWFRNDLRLRDHEALARIAADRDSESTLLCVWIYGDRPRSPFREKFINESLDDLREGLKSLGQNLFVFEGRESDLIPILCRKFSATDLWFQNEHTFEEAAIESQVERLLSERPAVAVHRTESMTLLKPKEIPFEIAKLPKTFTEFRKKVESAWPEISTWSVPDRLPKMPGGSTGAVLDLLGQETAVKPGLAGREMKQSPFRGGESAGMARLQKYFWDDDGLRSYKETRNGLLGLDYSSKFSPWLSTGSLSARVIQQEIGKYEEVRTKNDSTYWMTFELLWRDYFRFLAVQQGSKFFTGQKSTSYQVEHSQNSFSEWIEGRTAEPFINANMRELAATGFMSNRGRQNVASYLTRVLKCDWRIGADYFERTLVDYDAASNWGNWSYFSGTGNDPRDRSFNVARQAEVYDPNGDYVRHWLGVDGPKLIFDPEDPFPKVSGSRLQDPTFYSHQVKRHSADVDLWLGLSAERIEAELIRAKSYSDSHEDREFWIGTSAQIFQTPYTELREILETLQPAPGETIVDLGAGYGRMAHVLGRHFPGVEFHGYEFVRERCDEGRAAFSRRGLTSARLETKDVTTLDFSLESAKYYFIYDFGSRADVEKAIENMKTALSHRSIVVVARGGRTREIIDKKHLWLSYVVPPLHREHYSIYRTQDELDSNTVGGGK